VSRFPPLPSHERFQTFRRVGGARSADGRFELTPTRPSALEQRCGEARFPVARP